MFSEYQTLHKKGSFLWEITSVNVTKSAEYYGYGHIYGRDFNGKLHFLCSGFYAHMQRPTAKNDKNCDVPLRKHLHVSIKSQARYVSRIPEWNEDTYTTSEVTQWKCHEQLLIIVE